MSVDKLVDSTQLDADLTTVANAIRTKGGTVASLSFPSGMAQAIANIPSGGGGLAYTDYTASGLTTATLQTWLDNGYLDDIANGTARIIQIINSADIGVYTGKLMCYGKRVNGNVCYFAITRNGVGGVENPTPRYTTFYISDGSTIRIYEDISIA